MRISIFGLGYVGAVTGACMAKEGHTVIGVDPDPRKLDLIRDGKSPIVEDGLDDLMAEQTKCGRLSVSSDYFQAVAETDLSLICVGTPSNPNGSLRTDFVAKVAEEIGEAIAKKGRFHSVVVRSTVLPGTTEGIVIPAIEKGCPKASYGISMNPEFLREGVSIYDFYNPPYTVIGTDTKEEFDRVAEMYSTIPGETIHCKLSTAEAIKYGCNIFHALKITFANEMGTVCKKLGVDAREALEIICKDTKLNISSKYMKPGFAYGGSCLPKDMRAFTYVGRAMDAPLPMFEGSLASNQAQIERAAARVMAAGSKKVAMLGISFKEGTDDLRESPLVTFAEILIGKGYELLIFDPNVEYASLYGSNKQFIDKELPHLKRILTTGEEAITKSDVIVLGHDSQPYRELLPRIEERHRVFDFARVEGAETIRGKYDGLYW